MNSELALAWGDFLAPFPWDWFCTLTFREEVGSFRAHRLFANFVRKIEREARTTVGWFRGDEQGRIGGRFHMHALMLNTAPLHRFSWMKEWESKAGFARIQPFDPKQGAALYCAKYVTKDFGEWDLSEGLATLLKRPAPIQCSLMGLDQGTIQPSPSLPYKPEAVRKAALHSRSFAMNKNTAEDRFLARLESQLKNGKA